jgi:hypothetical protein
MLTIRIDTDNAAFEDNKVDEIIACLIDVVNKLNNDYTEANIHDTNGNVTGSFILK